MRERRGGVSGPRAGSGRHQERTSDGPLNARIRWVPLLLGVAAFLLVLVFAEPLDRFAVAGGSARRAAAVTALMAAWWITEALPIHWTACVPLVAFPLLGVFPGGLGRNLQLAAFPYADPYIFLFMGGMGIAAAMQQCGLHRRIALRIMGWIGTSPARLLLGVLAGTALISMWISNTATATLMLPIALAILSQLERGVGARLRSYGFGLMLAVAYGSNLGGIGTKIGTAPSAMLAGFLDREGLGVTFLGFMAVGTPFVALMLPVTWAVLWLAGRRDAPAEEIGRVILERERATLDPMSAAERVVFGVFLVAAALWILGQPITRALEPLVRDVVALRSAHVEGSVAMLAAIALLLWRVEGRRTLEWRSLRLIPWGTLLLLGGAFSMAEGIEASGASAWMGSQLRLAGDLGRFTQALVGSTSTVLLSAVASNTATVAVMLTVIRDAIPRSALGTVLFASTIAASCDFALPAGTPPNAIVFGSGYVSIPRMARTGIVLDLLAALLAAAWCWLAVPWVLG